MGRRSKVERLPDDVLKRINAMLADGLALDDVVAWLDEQDLPDEDKPSRSGLGRYSVNQKKLSDQLRNSRHVAEALAAEIGSESASQQGRVAVEVLHSTIMKMSAASLTGEKPEFSPAEILAMSKSTKELMSATDIDDKRRRSIRDDALREAQERTRAAVGEAKAKGQGITQETLDLIYSELLGVDG